MLALALRNILRQKAHTAMTLTALDFLGLRRLEGARGVATDEA